MIRVFIVAFAGLVVTGCSTSTACLPGGGRGMRPDGGCLDSWECPGIGPNSGVFQVRCTGFDAGWMGCQCIHDGSVVRTLEPPQRVWCHFGGSRDSVERIIDANRECGWALDTSGI